MRSVYIAAIVATACTRPPAADTASSSSQPPAPTPVVTPASASATPPIPKVERFPAGSGCLAAGDAQIAERQAAAFARTRHAFEAKLTRLGLTPVNLPVRIDDQRVTGSTIHLDVDGVSREYIVGASRVGCDAPEPWDFARNARGEIVHIIRNPQPATTTSLAVCGCETVVHRCPPSCGMPRSTQHLHPLPPGARFAGSVAIRPGVHSAVVTHETGVCPVTTAAPACKYAP